MRLLTGSRGWSHTDHSVTNPRRLPAIGLLAWAAVSSCQGSKTASLACKPVTSAQELCGGGSCDSTWTAVEANQAYCDRCGVAWLAGDCGDYHVLTSITLDTGGSYYYRRDTGTLIATEFWGPPSPTATCLVADTAAFTPPASCETGAFSKLSGWCSIDGGAPAEHTFSCCQDTLTTCTAGGLCPATWSQAQAQAASLCGSTSGAAPELGSCGGNNVFRYRLNSSLQLTLYYDASGLIAVVDEPYGRCQYGPPGGLTLPTCAATTLASACPDGGVAP